MQRIGEKCAMWERNVQRRREMCSVGGKCARLKADCMHLFLALLAPISFYFTREILVALFFYTSG